MIQGGSGASFVLKTFESVRIIAREVFWQEFQRDVAAQTRILRLIHHTHSTAAQFFDDPVVGDGTTDEGLGVRRAPLILFGTPQQVNAASYGLRRTLTCVHRRPNMHPLWARCLP